MAQEQPEARINQVTPQVAQSPDTAAAPIDTRRITGRNIDDYLTQVNNASAVRRDESLKHQMPNM